MLGPAARGKLKKAHKNGEKLAMVMFMLMCVDVGDEDGDEDPDKYDSVGVYKAREWDQFKDDNPYGSGNSALKPLP